ncbi:MAG: TonB-dependent receptor [Thermoanaerobaculum sp.]|nr:TonB-dependent receptor [Thermoanaerobaculum sp.]
MPLRWIFPLIFWISSTAAWAFTGVVKTAEGQPIPFARVNVLGTPGWAVANSQGEFSLRTPLKPPLTVVVTGSDGVLLGSFSFQEVPPGTVELRIRPRSETLTVTATRPPDLVAAPATAFSLVAQEDVTFRAPAQLTDVLDVIPNVGRLEEGHSVVPALRGLARYRSLLLLDDTRILAERRAGPSATFLDPLSLGEVEVARGAAGVAYGSDAFGGIIAARTRLANPGQPWMLRYHLLAAAGAPETTAQLEASGSLGPGALTVGVGSRDFDRYHSPKGEVFNSEATFRHARLGYQVPLGHGILRALWRSDWGRTIGKPAADSYVTRAYYPEENSHRFVLSFEAPLRAPWTRYAWSASWVEYQLITDRDRFATSTSPRQLTRADVSSHDYNLRFEAERTWAFGRLLVGADAYGRFGLKATNDTYRFQNPQAPTRTREVSIASARKDHFGAFVAYARHWGIWDLHLGLRGDSSRSKNRGGYFGNASVEFSRSSGFLALAAKPLPALEATVQYARGFRDAVLSDRFYRGISGRGFITGNPRLKPETSQQWDASLRYTKAPLRLALYAYHYEIRDFIERYRQGNDFFFRNRATARLKGLEVEGAWTLGVGLELVLGLQYPEGRIVDDDTFMDDIPSRGGFILLKGSRGPFRWESRFAAYARDTRPGPLEKVIPGYATWDAGASYKFSETLEVGLLARNLLDRAYYGSADVLAVLAPRRSVQLSLRGTIK